MKKYIVSLIFLMTSSLYAGTKVSSLTSDSVPLATDLTYEVKDPGGTPTSKRIAIGDLLLTPGTTVQHSSGTITNLNVTNINGATYSPGSGGYRLEPATVTPTFPIGVNASSFTSTGSGVGTLTIKDSDASNFVSLEASGTIVSNESYVLPSSTGTTGYVLSNLGTDGNGKTATGWAAAADPNAAVLTATQTFSGINTFAQQTNFTNVSQTVFNGVSSTTFNSQAIVVPFGSTISINCGIQLGTTDYGSVGQIFVSSGPNASPYWSLYAPTPKTLSQLQALVPGSNGIGVIYYCTDCTTDGIVVSTGAAIGSFGRISARTTAPQ